MAHLGFHVRPKNLSPIILPPFILEFSLLDNVDFVNGFLLFGFHLCLRLLYNAKEKSFKEETNEESQSLTV